MIVLSRGFHEIYVLREHQKTVNQSHELILVTVIALSHGVNNMSKIQVLGSILGVFVRKCENKRIEVNG